MACSCCQGSPPPSGEPSLSLTELAVRETTECCNQSDDEISSMGMKENEGAKEDSADKGILASRCCGQNDTKCLDQEYESESSDPDADKCQDDCCQEEDNASIQEDSKFDEENDSSVVPCADSCCGNSDIADEETTEAAAVEESCAQDCCTLDVTEKLLIKDEDLNLQSCGGMKSSCLVPNTNEGTKSKTSLAKACCGTAVCEFSAPSKDQEGVSMSSKASCDESCCDALDVKPTVNSDEPDCCRGKTSPCCDDSCLDRLALRDCETGWSESCDGVQKCMPSNCCEDESACFGTQKGGSACDGHRRAARDRYGATLEALGCICRALLALGKESCCETRKRSSDRKRCLQRASTKSLRRSIDSCCASGASITSPSVVNIAKLQGNSIRQCSSKNKTAKQGYSGKSCCKPAKAELRKDACAAACCANLPPLNDNAAKQHTPAYNVRDIEKQSSGNEHIILSVSGMTCTGCETKLNRTLATMVGIENLKTSLVLSRAEFDIDFNKAGLQVEDVIKHIERTTEFHIEHITNNGASIDIFIPGDASVFVNRFWPEGVIDISIVDKNICRVTFDPKLVGARDLLEKHFGPDVRLGPVRGDPSLEAGSKHVRNVGYMTIFSAACTIPVLVMAWAPLPHRDIAYGSASLALATVVQVFVAGPFYPKALKAFIFSRVIEMDLLIVLSTSAAFIFSVVSFGYFAAGKPLSTGQFFETSTLLVTLIMFGRYIAALARQKAVESISFQSLQTKKAILIEGTMSDNREIDARLLQYGDIFKVLPDSQIPTDGTVISGSSEVDESMLTGESFPVEKHERSSVIAGTLNGSGTLVVRLTRLPGENTINTIAAMVDEAKLSKPKMQDLADRVSSYFVPVIVSLTILTFVIWVAVGVAVRGQSGSDATVQALTYAITVLIVSCPCAIGLAVPMVVVIASGVAAERGVIFKSADAIEVAYKTSHVVFDKTGTLTRGQLSVVEEHCVMPESVLSLLLGLISDNKHPVSVAIMNHLRSKSIVATAISNAKNLTGLGIEAVASGQRIQAGNSFWLGLSSHTVIKPLLAQGYTVFCFAIDGQLAAAFGLEDSLRGDAEGVVKRLQGSGISVHIVSGDDIGAVQGVAEKLGIPPANTRGRSSPSDKQDYIKQLLGDGPDNKKPVVVFCGDGTNDAVALAQATIGVHMNEGTDVAQSAADVVLMRPDLSGIITMMNSSKQSVRRIKFNFGWSFVYNTFAILLAAGAFVNARIPPEYGGLGELVSVLPVILAAVLLRWTKI